MDPRRSGLAKKKKKMFLNDQAMDSHSSTTVTMYSKTYIFMGDHHVRGKRGVAPSFHTDILLHVSEVSLLY